MLHTQRWSKTRPIPALAQVEQLQGKLVLASVDPDEVKRLRSQKDALEGLCRSLQVI